MDFDKDQKIIIDIPTWLDEQGFLYNDRTNEVIADSCFNCGRSKKLYINKETGMFNCFRCGIKGNAISLVMKIAKVNFKKALEIAYGITDKKINANQKIDEENWEDSFQIKKPKSHKSNKEEAAQPISLPNYFQKLNKSDSLAWNYLRNRGIPDNIIEQLNIYSWKIAKRVVFTIETNNQIMGYMARDITGSQDPKTLNSKGNFRSQNFWNYDRVKDKKTIVICEGIFSAIKSGIDRSIALLGKVATKEQIELLRTTSAEKIILCLDVGTDEDQQKIYEELSVYYPGKIYRVNFPEIVETKEKLNSKILSEINSFFKTNIKELDEKTIFLNPKDKKIIKDFIKSKKMILKSKEFLDFVKFIDKSDYKDAGDYSFEEMNKFINESTPYKRLI